MLNECTNVRERAEFHPSTDGFTLRLIERKVRQLKRRPEFDGCDPKDLSQEILLRVMKGMELFDEDVGHRNPFIKTIVERFVANLVREQNAEKRDAGDVTSLSTLVDCQELGAIELGNTISSREYERRTGKVRSRSEVDQSDLRSDVETVIRSLPAELQTFLHRLKTNSIAEISRDLDIPRTTLNTWMDEIRERFIQAGFEKYF